MCVEGGEKRGEEDEHVCTRDIRQQREPQSGENCAFPSGLRLSSALSLSSVGTAQPAALQHHGSPLPFKRTQIPIMEVTLLLTKSPVDSLCYIQSGEIKSPFISPCGESFQRLVRRALMRWFVMPPITAARGTLPVVCWL